VKTDDPDAQPGAFGGGGSRPPSAKGGAFWSPLVRAGLVLGMGFGGLADGIILHQILGWHHLVCYALNCRPSSIEELQLENTQDGYFHLGLWLMLLAGTAMLFHAARRVGYAWSGRVLVGAMLLGSGLFNFVEGMVDHQILGIHHVLPGTAHQFLFDMLYLANGILFVVVGVLLIRSRRNADG
jgi:uncharacterized membrane protein